jgi:hypothetical protein
MTSVGRLPRAFWRAWLVVAVSRSAQFVEPFLPLLLLRGLAATPATLAAVLLAQQSAAVVGFVGLGPLADRFGVATTMRIGLAGAMVTAGVMAAVPETLAVGTAAVGYGAASALWRGAAQALVPLSLAAADSPRDAPSSTSGESAVRARAFGLLVLASNAGSLASAAVGAAGAPVRAMIAAQAAATGVGLLLSTTLPRAPGADATVAQPGMTVRAASAVRRERLAFWLVVAAVVPATALMFQAFSGLAVVFSVAQYRWMVLVNAAVLVLAQPAVAWILRRVSAVNALAVAGAGLGVGMALQARYPHAVALTLMWTLAELVVIIVPSAVVSGLAPRARVGSYVGRFQAVQGMVAAAATYLGPVLVARSSTLFAIACLLMGGAGAVAALGVRSPVGAAMRQPLECPCGALLCGCDATHHACATPTTVLVHAATPVRAAPAPGAAGER